MNNEFNLGIFDLVEGKVYIGNILDLLHRRNGANLEKLKNGYWQPTICTLNERFREIKQKKKVTVKVNFYKHVESGAILACENKMVGVDFICTKDVEIEVGDDN